MRRNHLTALFPPKLRLEDNVLATPRPEPTSYLYFVGKGNGTHQFSKTLTEHNAAVRKYQLGN